MPHKAELIMVAVEAVLTGLATTGDNIKRARVDELADAELPGLTLLMGEDPVGEEGNIAFMDRDLIIEIIAHVKQGAGVDTTLNAIRREVHVALYEDRKQGLVDIVIDTKAAGDGRPELSGELESIVAKQQLNYIISYRHSVNDPGA